MTEPSLKTPSFKLDGKRALITGGSRGIGFAAAFALAEAGAHIVLIARNNDDLKKACAKIKSNGGSCEGYCFDITNVLEIQHLFKSFLPIDILINNAGMNRPRSFQEVNLEDFDQVFNLNVKAAFFCAQTVVRSMIKNKIPGSIINISSQMGHVGGKKRSVYCATKHAIEGLTKAMALDLASYNIRVNSLGPTFIETPMTKPFFQDVKFLEETHSKIPLGRIGQVNDIMGAIVFLASEASSMMTGTNLLIDGGWTAQ